jgi:hypothetical protein
METFGHRVEVLHGLVSVVMYSIKRLDMFNSTFQLVQSVPEVRAFLWRL